MSEALVQKRKSALGVLRSEKFQEQLQMALPKIMPLEKFTRSIITQINNTPKLLNCSQESLFSAVITLAGAGIEADGYAAHILPYGKKATPIIDYKGMVELMFRSGLVAAVNGYSVREKDEFEFNMGEVTRHQYDFKEDRGDIIGAYTVVKMKGGEKSVHFMSRSDIDKIAKTSPAYSLKDSPWKKHYEAMAIKTVLRQHSKWVPISSEAKDIIMKEVESEVKYSSLESAQTTMGDLVEINPEPEEKEVEATVVENEPNPLDDLGDEFDQAAGVVE